MSPNQPSPLPPSGDLACRTVASEWVGVVGTVIGAGIAGAVTVANLMFNAKAEQRRIEHDDRLREQERAWTLRQQNLEARKALFVKLLEAAISYRELMRRLYDLLDFFDVPTFPTSEPSTPSGEELSRGFDQLTELQATITSLYPEVNVFAVEESVGGSTSELLGQLDLVLLSLESGDIEIIERVTPDAVKEVSALYRSIRTDLGVAAQEAEPGDDEKDGSG